MKNNNSILIMALLIGFAMTSGCKKETYNVNPALSFVMNPGYIWTDTLMPTGDTAIAGLNYVWNGQDPITTINVYLNNAKVGGQNNLPAYMSQTFTYNTKITKTLLPEEKWDFEVIDSKGNISRLGLVLRIDSGGEFRTVNAIAGAQNHASYGSYYNLREGIDFTESEAISNQELVDMVSGWDFGAKSFFASPVSEYFYDVYNLSSWGTKNSTKFCLTTISVHQYELIDKDNLLISAFHPDQAVDLVEIQPNQIVSFKTIDGKFGLIKIISIAESQSGYVVFDYKIQI